MADEHDVRDMNARLTRLELWRAAKDVLDEQRHQQNVNSFADQKNDLAEVKTLSSLNGSKLDQLILQTATANGAKSQREAARGNFFQIMLAAISGGALIEVVKLLFGK
jgi:type II secretory pathway component PulM